MEGEKSHLKGTQYLQCCAAICPLQTQHPQDISTICVALARSLTVFSAQLSLQLPELSRESPAAHQWHRQDHWHGCTEWQLGKFNQSKQDLCCSGKSLAS